MKGNGEDGVASREWATGEIMRITDSLTFEEIHKAKTLWERICTIEPRKLYATAIIYSLGIETGKKHSF